RGGRLPDGPSAGAQQHAHVHRERPADRRRAAPRRLRGGDRREDRGPLSMPDVSLVVAFAGGTLAILSPCGAMLLPAFFATAFSSRTRLLLQAPLFFAGIATIVMPLGLGVGAMSELVLGERDLVIAIAGAVLVGFGLYTFAGGGFAVAPGVSGRLQAIEGRFAAYATGLAYGLAGFCSGPIFGGVLTVAATSGAAALGGALLAAFALGMTLPVFVLALVWDRARVAQRRWLAHTVRLGAVEAPVSRAIAGSLFVALGVSFVAFRGSSALSSLYADLGLADLLQRAESALR